ncbi:hypothetical protein UCRPA7_4601 [Phaeoacremonium minimum UCRPA7]|uniref:DUF8035 domain-containing protein n=1 Tax=Phaeoacremonium minimum (strain UCR-PA7) TaxID=1286976 RepID=R8BKB5_PHAM7|nr:hypothetical protein UCRPA7_4601 [Phaeoacremonium minimum UCRPA7]EON99793.1 hypothetical protein UCRPA7_4601 [Phaeoacremonium minimum UCRPA7]
MARDPYRASTGDLSRGGGERWDRERFMFERDRDRFGDERSRFEEDDRYNRGPPRRRESVDHDRRPRAFDDDVVIRENRRVYYDDEPRFQRRRSPPDTEVDRRVVIERERERVRSPSPPRRPGTLLRRQSSLDTFDRRPRGYYEREEYGPPARREDFRPPTYTPIPLPRSKALPPPRRFAEREYYDEIKVSDPDYYGDDDYRPYPERVREKEIIKTRRRDRSPASRTSRGRSHRGSSVRGSSRSSSTSSRSSSSSGGTTVKSEYPKKGKTRIPRRLVSERALIDLGYPFVEEGNVIVVLKALGQDNIDDLLKLSEDYKKAEMQIATARNPPGGFIEERREDIYVGPPPPQPPPMMTPAAQYQQPAPYQYQQMPPPPPPVEVVNQTTVIRDVSPARSYTTTTSATPYIVDARPVEVSEPMQVGPLALVTDSHHHRSRSRSEIRSEIKDLERQLARSKMSGRDVVRAERLSDGQLVLYEERIEKIEEPHRGVRIEKDKKGRMAISVPKYR